MLKAAEKHSPLTQMLLYGCGASAKSGRSESFEPPVQKMAYTVILLCKSTAIHHTRDHLAAAVLIPLSQGMSGGSGMTSRGGTTEGE